MEEINDFKINVPTAAYERKPKPKKIGSTPFVIIMTAIITMLLTFFIIYYLNDGIVLLKYTRYGDLTNVIPVSEVMDNVNKEYYSYNGEKLSNEEMATYAMKGIVAALEDPYSQYFTAKEYDSYHKSVSGNYKGLGISVTTPDETGSLISVVYEDSPAEKAGLKVGDMILKIDGIAVADKELSFVADLLTGEDGDEVKLTLLRDEAEIELSAYYGDVVIKSVSGKMIETDVGYVHISQFSDNTSEEFAAQIDSLKEKGMKSLIIDVRNNPGGYLDSVVDIADQILDSGTIVSIGNTLEDPNLTIYKAKEGGLSMPIVLLINENSASASEILAAAVKENNAGTLIGKTTFGKGIVQTTGQLYSTDGYLKLTTSAYYTPDGNNIHKQGVSPDIYTDLDENMQNLIGSDLLTRDNDPQLGKALEWLGK